MELDEDNPLSKLSSQVVLDGASMVQVEHSVPCVYTGSGLYGRHCLPESNKQIPCFKQVLEFKSRKVDVKKCQTCLWK